MSLAGLVSRGVPGLPKVGSVGITTYTGYAKDKGNEIRLVMRNGKYELRMFD